MDKYKTQAKQLYRANFRVFGLGHFDIEEEELAHILELLDKKEYSLLLKYYEQLEQLRMG